MRHFIHFIMIMGMSKPVSCQLPTFYIDPLHSSVTFTMTYLEVMEFDGTAEHYYSEARFDTDQLDRSSVTFTVYAPSLKTGVENRDNDLHSEQYIDSNQYPAIRFTSTNIYQKDDSLFANGQLTIKGVNKNVTIPLKVITRDEYGEKIMYVIHAGPVTINRTDFGIGTIRTTSLDRIFLGDFITISIKALYAKGEATGTIISMNPSKEYTGNYIQSESSQWEVHLLDKQLFLMFKKAGIMWKLEPKGEDTFIALPLSRKVKFIRDNSGDIESFILQQKASDLSDGKTFTKDN